MDASLTESLRSSLQKLLAKGGRSKAAELSRAMKAKGIDFSSWSINRFAEGSLNKVWLDPAIELIKAIRLETGTDLLVGVFDETKLPTQEAQLRGLQSENEQLRDEVATQRFLLTKTTKELQALEKYVREAGLEGMIQLPERNLDEIITSGTGRIRKVNDITKDEIKKKQDG